VKRRVAAGGLLLLLCAGCSTVPKPMWVSGLSVQVGKPFIVVSRPATVGEYPLLHALPDGRLFVHSAIADRVSDDGGVTWRAVQPGENVWTGLTGSMDDVAYKPKDPCRMVGSNVVFLANIIRDGKLAESDVDVPVYGVPPLASTGVMLGNENIPAMQFWPMWHGVRMPGGEFLVTAFTRFEGDRKTRCVILRSDDQGRTLRYLATVATTKEAPWGGEGPNESALTLLPNGDLLCVMRTGYELGSHSSWWSQPMLQARSRDGGATWEDHRAMSVRGVNPMLAVLPNGVIACTAGRPGNNIVFSSDNGRSWSGETLLAAPDLASTGYMDLAPVGTNRLLVIYPQENMYPKKIWLWEPPQAVDAVMGVFIDVRRRGE
jgi:hypothetical protein